MDCIYKRAPDCVDEKYQEVNRMLRYLVYGNRKEVNFYESCTKSFSDLINTKCIM